MAASITEQDCFEKLYYLTHSSTKNWKKILKFGESLEINRKRKLLWFWPTENDLCLIKKIFHGLEINRILSIGCGNGLLEWILTEALDLKVFGLEVDRNWWLSNYSIKSFIPLNFIEEPSVADHEHFLQQFCGGIKTWDFALLFCYFNNHQAFLEYTKQFQGKWLIIIGPRKNKGVHSDPMPLNPNFPCNVQWILNCSLEIGDNDVIAIYENNNA